MHVLLLEAAVTAQRHRSGYGDTDVVAHIAYLSSPSAIFSAKKMADMKIGRKILKSSQQTHYPKDKLPTQGLLQHAVDLKLAQRQFWRNPTFSYKYPEEISTPCVSNCIEWILVASKCLPYPCAIFQRSLFCTCIPVSRLLLGHTMLVG